LKIQVENTKKIMFWLRCIHMSNINIIGWLKVKCNAAAILNLLYLFWWFLLFKFSLFFWFSFHIFALPIESVKYHLPIAVVSVARCSRLTVAAPTVAARKMRPACAAGPYVSYFCHLICLMFVLYPRFTLTPAIFF